MLEGYTERVNGIVLVHFSTPVEAEATISFTADGETFTAAKPIYSHGAAITAGIIGYGATALFLFDGDCYNLLCVDTFSRNYGSDNAGDPVVVGADGFPTVGSWQGGTPAIGAGDEGKVLTVVSGSAAWGALPETTTSEIDAIIAAI